MSSYAEVLEAANDIVLHNWPKEDVPETLARAGYAVTVVVGPRADDIYVHEVDGGEVVVRRAGRPLEHADLVYVFPWPGFVLGEELPRMAAEGKRIGASVLWYQSGRASDGADDLEGCWLPDKEVAEIRRIAEAADLRLIHDVYIANVVREFPRAN
ncbi:Rossmann-fold NAD(P)-binding domain-containing protein [Flindersiella endophytica]